MGVGAVQRSALISDLHGNAIALREALRSIVAVTLHRVALDRRELVKAALDSANPMGSALAAAYL